MINTYGGRMEGAVGVSEDQLRQAAHSAVCKVNIDSDCRLAVTAAVRKVLAEDPGVFDPRKYLGSGRDELTRLVKHKNKSVLGSAGHGREIMAAVRTQESGG
jgi:fructose-bisphosphate aldolase class II